MTIQGGSRLMGEAIQPGSGPSGWVYLGGENHWLLASGTNPDELAERLASEAGASTSTIVDIRVLLRPDGESLILHVAPARLQYFAVGRDLASAPGSFVHHARQPGEAGGIR